MSQTLAKQVVARQHRDSEELYKLLDFGLVGAIAHLGGELHGFSVKLGEGEVLITLRVEFDYGKKVAFVASIDMQNTLRKAFRQASKNELRWKDDKFGG